MDARGAGAGAVYHHHRGCEGGLASSGYVWNDAFGGRLARPHDTAGKPTDNKKSSPESVARYGSAGALLTTPTDYAKFLIEVINPKPSDAHRLQQASIDEMLRPHVKIDGGQYPASWALGWQIFHHKDRDFIYHGGDNEGRTVSNPNIGYGLQTIKYADGKTREFYQIGISANTTGISVYILGIKDKKYLAQTFGKELGKASVTGYCVKFKTLKDINIDILEAAIRYGIEQTNI